MDDKMDDKMEQQVGSVKYKKTIENIRDGLNEEDILQIWIKLSDKQIETLFIQEYIFDLDYIKELQNKNRYPVPNPELWKVGKNFEGAIYVGTRTLSSGNVQDVYLKHDGWFTTPKDITNCLPITDNIEKDEAGYKFLDATAIKSQYLGKSISDYANTFKGGKTRKYGKRKSRKTKRRYRK
jgi:hypothetical protein